MIDDLDKTIETLLKKELPENWVEEESSEKVSISFAAPDNQFPPSSVTLPAIDLFLYDVRENRDLRSNEWLIERNNDGTANKKIPPVRVECSYLITAWASDTSPTPVSDEHSMLGEVIKALLRHPKIPPEVLQGSLKGQEPPLPTAALQDGRLQSVGEFWQAMGGKPKVAFHYTVTISMPVFEDITGPMVTTKTIGYDVGTGTMEESFVQIGGRVMDSEKNGIPDAIVDMEDVKLRSKTNGQGQYIFSKVPIGEHTVRIVAVGFQPKTKTIIVPGQSEEYEITLDSL